MRSRFSAIAARLLQHRTTLDPFLDDSGSSIHRLGDVSFDGETHDALEGTLSADLIVQIATTAPATLRAACAAIGPAGARVAFEIAIAADGRAGASRGTVVEGGGIGRWHTLTIPVPAGHHALTMRARSLNDAAPARARWSVPTLTWRKSAAALLRSTTFSLRSYGVAGTARRLRGRMDETGDTLYAAWFAEHAAGPEALAQLRARAESLKPAPRFALIVEQEHAPRPDLLRRLAATVDSVDAQVYDAWELWVPPGPAADLGSRAGHGRVRVCGEDGADEASGRNAALASSSADFVAVLSAGDRLAPDALFRIAERLAGQPDADVLYCDEDVQGTGMPRRPRFKPDWSPEYLRSRMYVGRLLVIRRALAVSVGGYRPRFAGALDYDLALRATRAARAIVHLPFVLYHRADEAASEGDGAHADAAAALADVYASEQVEVTVTPGARPGVWRARVPIRGSPRVAIAIPTDGQGATEGGVPMILNCVRNVRARTSYPNYELLVCDNGNLSAEALAFLETVPHRRATYTWEGAFNFSHKIDFTVAQTSAPYVLILNDDIEPINADWLTAMLEYAQQPAIGAVGAKLFYPDGRLQHVGVAVGVCGVTAHLLHQHPGGSQGCDGIAVAARNCSAVTGACMLTRRAVWDELGGFDVGLPIDFNDVDFCLRMRQAGYRIVYSPHARLFHRESASIGARQQNPEEIAAMRRKWGSALEHDPYYNVNLSRQFPDCRPAAPRR